MVSHLGGVSSKVPPNYIKGLDGLCRFRDKDKMKAVLIYFNICHCFLVVQKA